ncbi:MAG TPA: FkbM family methyltransferase [Gaiellaceae bacterium]|nr:FkbM family methyltransferase [Gaiellaceae bacterium]
MRLSSPAARLARGAVNRATGDEIRVVRVLSGVARGSRLALDLSKEKAYWIGHYERPLQHFLRENVGSSDVFFDVGAHVGFFSVCAARLGARVVAVEPDTDNAARLRRNVELNGLDIAVVEAAAWVDTGTVALVPGGSAKEFQVAPGKGVLSISLDDLAARYGSPTVIKLDVEGAEARALEGARHVLSDVQPIVVCELHGAEQRERVVTLLDGYSVEKLESPDGLVARPARRIIA